MGYYQDMMAAGRGHLLRDSDKDDGTEYDGISYPDCRRCSDDKEVTVSDPSNDAGYNVVPCPACCPNFEECDHD